MLSYSVAVKSYCMTIFKIGLKKCGEIVQKLLSKKTHFKIGLKKCGEIVQKLLSKKTHFHGKKKNCTRVFVSYRVN